MRNEDEQAQIITGCVTLICLISSGPVAGLIYYNLFNNDTLISCLIAVATWISFWFFIMFVKHLK